MQASINKNFQTTEAKCTQHSNQQVSVLNPYHNLYVNQSPQFYTGQMANFQHHKRVKAFTPSLGAQKKLKLNFHTTIKQQNKEFSTDRINFNYPNKQTTYRNHNQLSPFITNQFSNEKIASPSVFTSNIDIDTIVKSMNSSSLRQMSHGQNIRHQDIMKLLKDTVDETNRYSMMHDPKTQSLKHYFRIIQLSQSELFQNGTSLSLIKLCQSVNQKKKKYQILITLDGKEIKFQSMSNRNLRYNINLDTVKCEFIQSQKTTQFEHRIKFTCGQKQIQMFINQSSLPFHLAEDRTKVAIDYIDRSAKQITKFMAKAITKSRGAQFNLMNLIDKESQFFTKNYATEQQFTQYCQTGDILLFKDNHTFAKIQRAITNSQYDHIAFVYRSQKYGVCLIEASSGFGVSMTVWTHLVRKHWFRGIQSISWRRLLIHNKPKDYEKKVEQFITDNKNKKYGISFKKLLTFDRKEEGHSEGRNRTFFCSQLVAELYKVLGLLDPKVSSTQYWPKHFSQNGYIAMLKNSALDKERILVFDEEILKQNYRGYRSD